MAVEAARGCGHRKVGGLYLTGSYVGVPCCRLPAPIDLCPTCGAGVKFTRSIQWVKAALLFKEPARCVDSPAEVSAMRYLRTCPLATIETSDEKHALMWVGEAHYPTPDDFEREANMQGISKRIAQLPKGLVIGKTRIFLAHKKTVECLHAVGDDVEHCPKCKGSGKVPGVFSSFVPQRLERVVTETMKRIAEQWADLEKTQPDLDREQVISRVLEAVAGPGIDWRTVEGYEWVKDDLKRGITLVGVPDDDPDHAARAPRKRRSLPKAPEPAEAESAAPEAAPRPLDAFGGGDE